MTRSQRAAKPQETDGPWVADFIQGLCRNTKGRDAGEYLRLRPWQSSLLDELFVLRPDGLRQHRRGLIGLPRKNGKSAVGAGIALWGLIADEEPGAEIYSCAGDRDQARIVFGMAKRMVELEPELSAAVKVYRDAIEYPANSSVYRVLSAEAYTKEGLNPSLVLFDEVHVQPNDDLWNVMTLGSGTRAQPLILGITTAGVKSDATGGDSLCYRLYQYGRQVQSGEVDDPSFFFRWWEPAAGADADWRDPDVWDEANPALGDFLFVEDFETSARTTPENEFRTKRLNQWVSSRSAWLPQGAWEACVDATRVVADGDEITVGFDGSYSGDSTALVGCTTVDPHLFVIEAWERKDSDDHDWRVPIAEVEQAIRTACARWKVREVDCDPFRWSRTMAALEEEGWPIVEWNTSSPARMVPACAKFYDAVMEQRVTHDGDPRLARHIDHCVLKTDGKGPRIVKEHKMSPRKIDLAVCAVVAHDRAVQISEQPGDVWFAFT